MRILVIEDDLALSAGLCFELDSNGYLTVAAYNCRKARQLLQEDQFDLAIMDVNLPDGNGFDLCREVKAIKPELPVIFLTANDLEQDVLNGFDLGAEDYITKPFNMQIFSGEEARFQRPLRTVGLTVFFCLILARLLPCGAAKSCRSRPTNISC